MIRKLAPYTKGYRVWIFLGVLCSAGEAVLELLLPKAMSQIVDVGIANGRQGVYSGHGPENDPHGPGVPGDGRGGGGPGSQGRYGFGANVRAAEYAQVQRFSFANIERFSTASLITRLTNDVSSVPDDPDDGDADAGPGSGDADHRPWSWPRPSACS